MDNLDIKENLKYLRIYINGAMTIISDECIKDSLNHIKNHIDDIYYKYTKENSNDDNANELNLILEKSINSLKLTTRAMNSLKCEDIFLIKQLIRCSESDLLKTPYLGKKSIKEIKNALNDIGLHLSKDNFLYTENNPERC